MLRAHKQQYPTSSARTIVNNTVYSLVYSLCVIDDTPSL